MNKYLIDETTLVNIADRLRSFKAYDNPDLQDTKYTPKNMPNGVDETYNIGYGHGYKDGDFDGYNDGYMIGYDEGEQKGYSDGEKQGYQTGYAEGEQTGFSNGVTTGTAEGYADGYNEGHTAGKQAEKEDFWYKYQKGGALFGFGETHYMFGGPRWNDDTFYPMYDINLAGAAGQSIFQYNGCTNIKQRLEECGVKITSTYSAGITQLNQMFISTQTKELPPIYKVKPPSNGNGISMTRFAENSSKLVEVPYYDFFNLVTGFTQAFNGCLSLERVVGIDFSSATAITSCFTNCSKLSDITVHGTIPVSISFSYSPLTVESMKSIITHLKNCSGTEDAGKYTLTLKDSCKTLMAEQGTIEELGGKTYDQYITDIGWNLA